MPTMMMIYMWVFCVVLPLIGLVFTIDWGMAWGRQALSAMLALIGYIFIALPIYYAGVFFFGEMIFG